MKKRTIEEMGRLSVEEFHEAKKLPVVVVLDNVRSQHNVGAIFRTADAFLLEAVYLCGISPRPDTLSKNNDLHKTALGAEMTVDWVGYEKTMEAIEALKAKGYAVYAIEQAHDAKRLEDITAMAAANYKARNSGERGDENSPKGVAIVMGHEVFGVAQEVVDSCEGCIELPQYGTKHSLNVSVTAGIVMHAFSHAMRNA